MQTILSLLARFGLFAHKRAHVDPRFEQRLNRICLRETRRKAATGSAQRG